MTRIMRLVAIVIAILVLVAPSHGRAEDVPFERGASLQAFTFPETVGDHYAEDPYPSADDTAARFKISELPGLGLDHVRLPVDVGPLLDDLDGKVRQRLVDTLRDLIKRLHAERIGVILTFVAPSLGGALPDQILDGPDGPKFRRYLAVAEALTGAFADLNEGPLAIEPMNEPQQPCVRKDGPDWSVHQPILLARLRVAAPKLWLGVTGGCWSKIEGLGSIDKALMHDPKTYLSVHFYDPFLFTHQGTDWSLDIMPLVVGLPYPPRQDALPRVLAAARKRSLQTGAGSKESRKRRLTEAEAAIRYYFSADPHATMADTFAELRRRAAALGITTKRVVFTEFGAVRSDDGDASRARWLRDVSGMIEEEGAGWTLWVLRGGPFGIDRDNGGFEPALLRALRLHVPSGSIP